MKTTSWLAVPEDGASDVSAKANVPGTLAVPPERIAFASDWPARIDVDVGETLTLGVARITSTSTLAVMGA